MRLILCLLLTVISQSLIAQEYLRMIEAGNYPLQAIQQEAEAYFKVVGRERGTGYKPFKRWEYVASMELDEQGIKIPNNELARLAREYRQAEKTRQLAESNSSQSGNWQQLGPTYYNATSSWNPGVGRITSIGLDEQNPQHVIVGSPSGGVWKTTDGCATWTPIADNFSTVDVYALEISPYNSNQYLWGSTGGKIFRSTDAGQNWVATSNVSGGGKVIRILYHPVDPNIVYAVSETNGLFRSTNSGQNWSAVAGVGNIKGYDVEFKPGDPQTIYFSGTSVFKSTNGGTSFTEITGFNTADNSYKMMGVSPQNPEVLYVLEANGGRFGAFYKSTNSGASVTKLIDGADINYFGYSSTGDDDRGQAPRDMDVAAHPDNAEEVHIAGIHTWKSVDGGLSFQLTSYWTPGTANSLGVGYNHADIDILKFYGNTLYVGSDGGIFTSIDHAQTFQNRTVGLGVREFYKIGVSKTNPNVVSGGSQDNGTSVMRTNNRVWVDWLGADGMESFVDWNNPNILYGTSQNGSMYRSTNQGNSYNGIDKPEDVDGAWITPFEQDPQSPGTIYVAFADVWKSPNSGNSWVKISDFANGNMNHLKLAPSNNQRIYAARGSNLYTTGNGGTNWTTITSAWNTSTINFIAVHPLTPERVVIVTNSNVYHSTNAGMTWTTIGAGLPSGTKYCATWENKGKNGLYVGGFGFVSYTNDDLAGQWVGYFDGLPNVRVYELEINYVSNTIFAGTYGRGLWESPLYLQLPPVTAFNASLTEGCGSLTVQFTDQSENNPNLWEWTFEGGTPATSNEQNPTVTFTGAGQFSVELRTSNLAGDNVLVKTGLINVYAPNAPTATGAARCGEGELTLNAQGQAGEQLNWYAAEQGGTSLFSGDAFTVNLNQDAAYYVGAGRPYQQIQKLGPPTNSFGGGSIHTGGYYLQLTVEKPMRLKSALVYASGSSNRTFQLRDASGTVLQERILFLESGEQRVTLDFDIPVGAGWRVGCPTPASLYRNNNGVTYPYTLAGVAQITGSTGGANNYYYLYDLEIQTDGWCEGPRALVMADIQTPPAVPIIQLEGDPVLCNGETALLRVTNACEECEVSWSNGAVGDSLWVAAGGSYVATMFDPSSTACANNLSSNVVEVSENTSPTVSAELYTDGDNQICPGESQLLTVSNNCTGCTVQWSNGTVGDSLWVEQAGSYTAVFENGCGLGPTSSAITITQLEGPPAALVVPVGTTQLCISDSVTLQLTNVCSGCSIIWSNGATTSSIAVTEAGVYTAQLNNLCGLGISSAPVEVSQNSLPDTPEVAVVGANVLCPGDSVLLTVQNGCIGCTYEWSNGMSSQQISVNSAGVYFVSQSNGCGSSQASLPISIEEKSLPQAPEILANDLTAFCEGDSVTISATFACTDCTLHWSNGETAPSIVVSTTGLISASLQNECGFGPVSNELMVVAMPPPPAPVIAPSGSLEICPGASVVLNVLNDPCGGCQVVWSNGATGMVIQVSEPGLYSAVIQDPSNACFVGPLSNLLEVTQLPEFLPAVAVLDSCHLSAPAGSQYQWLLNGNPIAGANEQQLQPDTSGNYSVSMLSPDGCAGQSAQVFAEACVSSLVELGKDLKVKLYPNPAHQQVFLEAHVQQNLPIRLTLFAVDGRLIGTLFDGVLAAGEQTIPLSLPNGLQGVYLYRITSNDLSYQGFLLVND
ncbi:MAG: T9SS type A sorting domain-containing protein [Saprospiraceae bacterium]|nr:T9SS type A sorting domain-containing protein [Saprospiraceae bacterium]